MSGRCFAILAIIIPAAAAIAATALVAAVAAAVAGVKSSSQTLFWGVVFRQASQASFLKTTFSIGRLLQIKSLQTFFL
jgi:hypothetical protein